MNDYERRNAYQEHEKKLKVGPVNLGGEIGRLVELPDGSSQVETWTASGWEYGTGADVYSIMRSPIASPEILRKYRIPKEFWSDIVLEEDRLDQERQKHGGS